MKQVVIMPGGFHPFHAGHYALYKKAQDAFPGADVYVAATNDTSSRPFPFALKEKLAKLAGVNPGKFIQVKSPFRAMEIVGNMDPASTQLIFVRSQKDADKPPQAGGIKKDGQPAYLQLLKGQTELAPMSQHAYMAYLPTVEFGPGMTSATEIRTAWPTLNEKRKTALVMSLYPKTQTNPKLAATVVKMLDTAMGVEDLNEFAPSDDNRDDKPQFLPWNEFIGDLEAILDDHFSVVQKVIKNSIQARFVPHDPMEFGPTMLYSYYEARLGRNKGAVSKRGAIQVGKYYPNDTALGKQNFITQFSLLKGHPFERHFDLTGDNVQNIADIIIGNTQGAYQMQSQQGVAEAAKKCPPATQDITLNLANRQKAIDEYGYGPLNPDMPNTKFWMAKQDEWNLDSAEEAKQSLCGNCAAFDIRQDTLDCIAQGIDADNPEDAEDVIDAGDLGYCKFLKFKCASRRTCDAWVTGGPLTDKQPVNEDYVAEKK